MLILQISTVIVILKYTINSIWKSDFFFPTKRQHEGFWRQSCFPVESCVCVFSTPVYTCCLDVRLAKWLTPWLSPLDGSLRSCFMLEMRSRIWKTKPKQNQSSFLSLGGIGLRTTSAFRELCTPFPYCKSSHNWFAPLPLDSGRQGPKRREDSKKAASSALSEMRWAAHTWPEASPSSPFPWDLRLSLIAKNAEVSKGRWEGEGPDLTSSTQSSQRLGV